MRDHRGSSGCKATITRRQMLGGFSGVAALAGVGQVLGADARVAKAATSPTAPNIVCIVADDLGWSDVSTPLTNAGNPSDFYQTPALDRLAREGMAFDNAYACPNCVPSRAAFLTGQYASRPTNNLYQVGSLNRGGDDTLLVGPAQGLPNGDDALPDTAVTVGETLQAAGYATGYVGKFHVSVSAEAITSVHGFDEKFGGNYAGSPGEYHAVDGTFAHHRIGPELDAFAADYTQQYVDENIKPYSNGTSMEAIDALVGTGKHVTDAVADATLDFVQRRKDGPFFVIMSHYAVHTPIGARHARSDLLDKYHALPPGNGPSRPSYGALIEGLDQTVARVVDQLSTTPDPRQPDRPLADNTVVVFISDNGGRLRQSDVGPLRGRKASFTKAASGCRSSPGAPTGRSSTAAGSTRHRSTSWTCIPRSPR